MLQLSYIRENKDLLPERYQKRNFKAKDLIEEILQLDEKRRKTQQEMDSDLAESKKLAKEVGEFFKSGQTDKANQLKVQTKTLRS